MAEPLHFYGYNNGTSSQLINTIRRISDRTASPAVRALIDEIRQRHGEAVQGILFYGSCLRSGDDLDGLVDLYLLVDDYRSAFKSRWQAFLNALLPPNVYYLELKFEGQVVRTKYAVLSLADFQKGTSMALVSLLPVGKVLPADRLALCPR